MTFRYQVKIYDHAEKWHFFTTIDATDHREARNEITKAYSPPRYSIHAVQFDNTYPGNFPTTKNTE